MIEIPEHLGGHIHVTKVDVPVITDIKKTFNIKSVIDIGCGPGGMQDICNDLDISWYGLEGDPNVMQTNESGMLWDLTTGIPPITKNFDLAWSTEFLEHIEEKYIPNFLPIFQKAKYACCSGALPGTPGHHHVNCQPTEYWIAVFNSYGFDFDATYTNILRNISVQERIRKTDNFRKVESGKKQFFKTTGMFFVNRNI